jgi:hypothetical protein
MGLLRKSRSFLKETRFSKTPTDKDLDNLIIYVNDILKHIYPHIIFILKKKIIRFIKYHVFSIKSWLSFIIRLFVFTTMVGILYIVTSTTYKIIDKGVDEITNNRDTVIEKIIYRDNFKSYEDFIHDIGKKESNNDWKSRRVGSQYVGWFQFGNLAFDECKSHGLDIDKFGLDNFLNNPTAQKLWFETLLKVNKKYLTDIILKWNHREIYGIKGTVTESGILMGAHLVGAGACRIFFNSHGKIVPTDGNGIPITSYIENFSGYKLPSRL